MSFFSSLGSLFGGDGPTLGNPAEAGMQYLNQIPGVGKKYYEPFITEGQTASGIANPVYNKMTQDPNEFINSIMRNYNPSEGYRFKEKQMLRAAQNDAAAGGFAGTPYSQQQQAETVQGLLGNDMQQFLENIFRTQGAGLQGQEGRIGRGFEGSKSLADYLGQALGAQAGMAFQGQQQQNQNQMSRFQNQQARNNALMGLIGQGVGFAMGGGPGMAMGGGAGGGGGRGFF